MAGIRHVKVFLEGDRAGGRQRDFKSQAQTNSIDAQGTSPKGTYDCYSQATPVLHHSPRTPVLPRPAEQLQ